VIRHLLWLVRTFLDYRCWLENIGGPSQGNASALGPGDMGNVQGNASALGPGGGYTDTYNPGMTVTTSINENGTIDIAIDREGWGFLNDRTESIDPFGNVTTGGALANLAFDMGFRSTYTSGHDETTGAWVTHSDPLGLFNASVNVSISSNDGHSTDTYGFGTIASSLMDAGLPGSYAALGELAISIGTSVLLGAPVGAIAPVGKALGVLGVVDNKTSETIQAVGLVAGFFQGTISNARAAGFVSDAKSYGAITGVQAALMGGMLAYSQYNITTNLIGNMKSLGFSVSPADLAGWGYSSDGNDEYINGSLVTLDSLKLSQMAGFVRYMGKPDSNRTDFDFGEWMAGGVLLNNYMAGGNIFSASASVGMNWLASAGKEIGLDSFSRHTLMQEDMIETNFVQYTSDKKLV